MTFEELDQSIAALFEAHPCITASEAGHVKHANRYSLADGTPIAWRRSLVDQHNLYVRLDQVLLARLKDVKHSISKANEREGDEPNAAVFHRDAFSKAQDDIAVFHVTDIWQGVRVLAEVVGLSK